MSNNLGKFENEIDQFEKKDTMKPLLKACVGILSNLQQDGRNFNLSSNCFVNELFETSNDNYGEFCNEIYDKLHTLMKKIGEA